MTWRCFVVKAFWTTCALPLPLREHEYSNSRVYLKASEDMLLACVRGEGARINGIECRSYLLYRRCGDMMCQEGDWIARPEDVQLLARLLERVYGPWREFERLWMRERRGDWCGDCVKMCAENLY